MGDDQERAAYERMKAAYERLNRVPIEKRRAALEPVPMWFTVVLLAITGLALWDWWYSGTPLFLVCWLFFVVWFGGEGVLR